MTAKSVPCQKVHFLWACQSLSQCLSIKDSCLQITGGWPRAGSTISIQQTTNNWHKLCHWQYSNSTFSLPPSAVPCPLPAPLGCVASHNVVYILSLRSVYPLPYVSIIGRDWCCQMYDWSLSLPSHLTTLSGPGYNWGSRSLPRSSMSTYHRNNPAPSILVTTITHLRQPSLLIITGPADSRHQVFVEGWEGPPPLWWR